jgi:hypothetical protein
MGVISLFSSCSCRSDDWGTENVEDNTSKRAKKRARQKKNKLVKQVTTPDPSKFEILETYEFRGRCIARVKYADATTFEGEKILVFDAPADKVREQAVLDPHFCEGDHLSPVARFKPTEWRLAKWFLHTWFAFD